MRNRNCIEKNLMEILKLTNTVFEIKNPLGGPYKKKKSQITCR